LRQFDGTKVTERRAKPRRASGARVWADPGGVLPAVDCKIIDISEEGAQVAPLSGNPLPDKFLLQMEPTRILGEADVVWREGARVGVRFSKRSRPKRSAAEPSAPSGEERS
jgi:hypothetical protein